jgi:hypothetical protein
MKSAAIASIPIIGLSSASQYVPTSIDAMLDASDVPNYNNIAALGESFHNAWLHCHDRTNEWILNELDVNGNDPAFDNGYYVEYSIKTRVPETYSLFNQILGSENFWDPPKFTNSDNLDVVLGNLPGHVNYIEAPKVYESNDAQTWITELNRPNPEDKTIGLYEGQALNEIKTWSTGGKALKSLFYNVQQISYYCDFTLESAQLSFSKVRNFTNSKLVIAERRNMRDMWGYLLKDQITPLRWNLQMWTRFNIAESAVVNMKNNFITGWPRAIGEIERLPVNALATELGWNYVEKKANQKLVADGWVLAMKNWIDSCYPMPEDRKIKTGSKICHKGIDYATIKKGEQDAEDMWTYFFEPLLEQYQKSAGYDANIYE